MVALPGLTLHPGGIGSRCPARQFIRAYSGGSGNPGGTVRAAVFPCRMAMPINDPPYPPFQHGTHIDSIPVETPPSPINHAPIPLGKRGHRQKVDRPPPRVWPSEFTELPKSATASINAPEASSIPLAAAPHLKPATPPPLAAEKPKPPSPPSPFTFEEPTPPPPKTGAGADLGERRVRA